MNIKLNNYLNDLDKEMNSIDKKINVKPIQETVDLADYVNQLMIRAETVGLSYDGYNERAEVYSKMEGLKKTEYFDISSDEYIEICKKYCDNVDDKYNHSNWFLNSFGDLVRIFTNLSPVVPYPCLTINVSRSIDDFSLNELPENLRKIIPIVMANRFVIAGQTGSGKTYFLNRALKNTFSGKYDKGLELNNGTVNSATKKLIVPKNISHNRIALVEEFHEIFPPNENTICLAACPVKPGEPNIFAYIVQQTNLMRLDNLYVGELKGEETFHFINNLSSGVKGGATCHGESCIHALERLRRLTTLSGYCTLEQSGSMVASALDFVVFINEHKIEEIVRVTGVFAKQQERFQLESIYKDE